MSFCNNCGVENPDNAKYCINCGVAMKLVKQEDAEPEQSGNTHKTSENLNGKNIKTPKLYRFLGWIFGIFFVLVGYGAFVSSSFIVGISCLVISAVLFTELRIAREAEMILGILGGIVGILIGLLTIASGGFTAMFAAHPNNIIFTFILGIITVILGIIGIVGGLMTKKDMKLSGKLMLFSGIAGFLFIFQFWTLAGIPLIMGGMMSFRTTILKNTTKIKNVFDIEYEVEHERNLGTILITGYHALIGFFWFIFITISVCWLIFVQYVTTVDNDLVVWVWNTVLFGTIYLILCSSTAILSWELSPFGWLIALILTVWSLFGEIVCGLSSEIRIGWLFFIINAVTVLYLWRLKDKHFQRVYGKT